MRGVHVVLEQLVLAEGGSAHGALIGEVGRLQRLPMIFRHVVQQLPLINLIHMDWVKLVGEETEFAISHLSTNRTSPAVLALVSGVLHTGGDQAMAAEQVPFQPLVREEPELALLAVQGRAIVDHLRVDFDLEKYFS